MAVPKIRFPEFTDDWEQRKLGDIASSFAYGLNAAAKEFDGKHKYLRITDIDDVSRVFQDDNLTSPDADIDAADDYRLEEGDLLFARTGASVGKSYIYKESDGLVYYAGFLIRAKIRPEYDAEFVFQNTLTSTYEKYIKTTSQRSGQPGVNAKEYAEYSMSLPEYAEQVKIGMFLRKIDDAITLHQRKLDDLRLLKKSMLQKMFPKEGKDVPETRFPGFTDAWEQRKLSNIADIVGGGTPSTSNPDYWDGDIDWCGTPSTSNPDYWDGDIDWYTPAEIGEQIFAYGSVRKITKEGLIHSSAKILPAHKTVLFTSRAGIGNMAILKRPAATNQGFQSLVCHDDIDPYFMFSMGDSIKAKAERVAAGSTFAEISGKKLGELEFMFPDTDEQKAIGAYFKNLDYLITLHQRKLPYHPSSA